MVLGAVRASSAQAAKLQLLATVARERRERAKGRFERAWLCTLTQKLLPRKPHGRVAVYELALPETNADTSEERTFDSAFSALIQQGLVEPADKKLL